MQPAKSHRTIYINTNGQPSTLPEMEGFVSPDLTVRSPDRSLIGDYGRGEEQNSSADSGPELQIPETSTAPPPLRSDSLVSYNSEEEDEEDPDGGLGEGLDPRLSAKEGRNFSNRQAMLLHRCRSQGSPASEPEDTLTRAAGHSKWGHNRGADLPVLGPQREEEESEPSNTDLGSFARGLMGPAWEKQPYEEQQQQQPLSVSPLGTGTLTDESLPPVSPSADGVSPSHSLPRGIGGSRPGKNLQEPCRTTLHRLMEMEEQWDQLYHHELTVWQEERTQQREERARDRDLQVQLLNVLTEIRDELRSLRQERAASRQERASQTSTELASPCLCLKPQVSLTKLSSEHIPLFYSGMSHCSTSFPAAASLMNGGRGERGIGLRSPQGISRRGRGRPRGSMTRQKRLLANNR
ncbi:uncharacterized protein [Erythrolamprus reginae]|uniref:uncharacterized protein n=1 Tax=Erythrolamprus reginae TaxID=121349 RepID=UPI00396CD0ED